MLRRLARVATGCLLGGAMSIPLGPTTTGRAVDRLNASSMRVQPAPPVPSRPAPDMVWVPDQYVAIPGQPGGVNVPGHWVRVTPDGHVVEPPLTVTVPGTGQVRTLTPGEAP
jgi:hypothetical protein